MHLSLSRARRAADVLDDIHGHHREPVRAQERACACHPVQHLAAICGALGCQPGDLLTWRAPAG
jgi:hypothetical protein